MYLRIIVHEGMRSRKKAGRAGRAQFQIGESRGIRSAGFRGLLLLYHLLKQFVNNSIRLPQRLRLSRIREHLLQRSKRCATQRRVFQQSVKPLARQPGVPVEDRTPYASYFAGYRVDVRLLRLGLGSNPGYQTCRTCSAVFRSVTNAGLARTVQFHSLGGARGYAAESGAGSRNPHSEGWAGSSWKGG
jgi:hypothetical protein